MFDTQRHHILLKRAATRFRPGDDFLINLATDDLIERTSTVKQSFKDCVVLFARSDNPLAKLREFLPASNVKRVEESVCLGVADHFATPDLLNLSKSSADLVLAPLTLHWSNDLPGTLIQILQTLRPNGLLLASLPGPDTLHELRHSLLAAESEISGGAANRIDPFTDIRDAGSLLQRAGFALPVVDQEMRTVRYDSAFDLISDLRTFGVTSHLRTGQSQPLSRAIMFRMAEIYAEQFSDPDGRIRATFSLISLSGWAPHESQQKPLKPGSAKARLADALNVKETKL